MTDEEKKAMIELNHFSNMTAYWKQEEYTNSEIDNYIKLILNLIEKQSKEIEELKENECVYKDTSSCTKALSFKTYKKLNDIDKKWEDKIKAKIEELKAIADNGANAVRFAMTHEDEIERIQKQKDIGTMVETLQSLLEKE